MIGLTASWLLQDEQQRNAALEVRAAMVREGSEVLQYIAGKSGVVFASMVEVVKYMKSPQSLDAMRQQQHTCVSSTPV